MSASDPFGAPARTGGDGVRRDRYGRYLLPDPATGVERAYTRATTLARTLADEYGLSQWRQRLVAAGVARSPDLIALAASSDLEEDKDQLASVVEKATERAGASSGANLGTALHAFTRDIDRGDPGVRNRAPESLHADLGAYWQLMDSFGLVVDPRHLERVVVCPALDGAGTVDKFVLCSDGFYRALDTKTAKSLEYSYLEIAVQLALYVNAEFMWDTAAGVYEPMPEPLDRTMGLVLWLPVGKATPQLYAVNLTAGLAAANVAVQVRAMRKAADSLFSPLPLPPTPPDAEPGHYKGFGITDTGQVVLGVGVPEPDADSEYEYGPTDRERVLSETLMARIAVAPDVAHLQFLAKQSESWWTQAHQNAAAKRWSELQS